MRSIDIQPPEENSQPSPAAYCLQIYQKESKPRGLLREFRVGPHSMNAFARGRMAQHIVHGSALYERTERFMLFTEILSTFVGQAVEDPFREPEVPAETVAISPELIDVYRNFSRALWPYAQAAKGLEGSEQISLGTSASYFALATAVCKTAHPLLWSVECPGTVVPPVLLTDPTPGEYLEICEYMALTSPPHPAV